MWLREETAPPARLAQVNKVLGPVLVTGATGTTGRRVVDWLARVGAEARAVSRSSETPFDWTKPDTWQAALSGVRSVYLVPDGSPGPEAITRFCGLAASEGVASIVLASTREAEYPGYERYLAVERAVKGGGTAWTMMRPSWFDQNFHTHFDDPVRSGLLALPTGEGRDPFIDAEDIAAVAVKALTEPGHEGKAYHVTGPEALSYRDAVARISELTGLTVRYEPLTEDEFIDRMMGFGMPEADARHYAIEHRPVAVGNNEETTDDVRRLLGRPPRSFDDFVRSAVVAHIWPPRSG